MCQGEEEDDDGGVEESDSEEDDDEGDELKKCFIFIYGTQNVSKIRIQLFVFAYKF